jgi:hypothetical protein
MESVNPFYEEYTKFRHGLPVVPILDDETSATEATNSSESSNEEFRVISSNEEFRVIYHACHREAGRPRGRATRRASCF